MAFKFSTGFKNAICNDKSVAEAFNGGTIKVYSAPTGAPDSADDAIPVDAVLLCTYSDSAGGGGLTLDTSTIANGVISKLSTQTWSGVAGATGVGAFFRLEQTGDTQAASTTLRRVQGLLGLAGADLNVASLTYTSGLTYVIDFFSLAFLDS